MSEGKRTPGPFQLEAMGCVYRHDQFSLRLSHMLDNAEQDELVDLLNKGTHYDGMLEALKGCVEAYGELCQTGACSYIEEEESAAFAAAEAAIAVAEPTAKG